MKINARRCKKLLDEGQYNRASSALVSEGLVDSTPETIEIMKKKHPQEEIQPMEVGVEVKSLKMRILSKQAEQLFSPLQIGISVQGGCWTVG